MTAEQLHDAITLLPSDLITEADKKRTAPRTVIRWQRYAAMAACFALVICGSVWCIRNLGLGGAKETAAEAPAAMQSAVFTEAAAEEAAAEAAEAAPREEAGALPDQAPAAAGSAQDNNANTAYAAVPTLTLSVYGTAYELSGEDAGTVTGILLELDYRKEAVCECIAEITAVIDGVTEYHINLEEGFVRCAEGQAMLTQEQIDTLQAILERLEG